METLWCVQSDSRKKVWNNLAWGIFFFYPNSSLGREISTLQDGLKYSCCLLPHKFGRSDNPSFLSSPSGQSLNSSNIWIVWVLSVCYKTGWNDDNNKTNTKKDAKCVWMSCSLTARTQKLRNDFPNCDP